MEGFRAVQDFVFRSRGGGKGGSKDQGDVTMMRLVVWITMLVSLPKVMTMKSLMMVMRMMMMMMMIMRMKDDDDDDDDDEGGDDEDR